MAGSPKPGFYVAVLLVIAGFVGFAFYRMNAHKTDPGDAGGSAAKIDINKIRNGSDAPPVESADNSSLTTVKEYAFDPTTRLPEIKGAGDYKKLGTPRTVRFAVNVWAGWAP